MVAKIKYGIACFIIFVVFAVMLFCIGKFVYDTPFIQGMLAMLGVIFGVCWLFNWALDEVTK